VTEEDKAMRGYLELLKVPLEPEVAVRVLELFLDPDSIRAVVRSLDPSIRPRSGPYGPPKTA
jgi:hypothetical protein